MYWFVRLRLQTTLRCCPCACHALRHASGQTNRKKPLARTATTLIDTAKIRNIGIMAHIDAGKTTTTERMLFYSGYTRHLGDVDDGDTVMDYMEQERARGITIMSAAITFLWNKHKINLIDTPGHVDFTLEVERSLRVLDGAVAVLDASAGVEAQTVTVWRQADSYHIPRIVFVNKMDKKGAHFSDSVQSLVDKLHIKPLILQIPIGQESYFKGVVDLVKMERVLWAVDKSQGRTIVRKELSHEDELYDECIEKRNQLVETLVDLDETLADLVLSDTHCSKIPVTLIHEAIRTATLKHQFVPILCGSALKNKGVQPLLDAVVSYLPSPMDVQYRFVPFYKDTLCALAFKIIHDKQRGPLTFTRIYSGQLESNSNLYNVNRSCTEKTGRMVEVYADEYRETSVAQPGSIIAIAGLKQTVTGDTLVSTVKAVEDARKLYMESNPTSDDADDIENHDPVLAGMQVPEPVFLCSVEPASMSQQRALEGALACLSREDPSLRVTVNTDTGQTILAGMGELHLEIIHDRIRKEYKVDAELGEVFIAYRESISSSSQATYTLDRMLGNQRHMVTVSLSIKPASDGDFKKKLDAKFLHDVVPHCESILKERELRIYHRKAIKNGIISAFSRGPILHFPVVDTHVCIHDLVVARRTSLPMVTAAVAQTVTIALQSAESLLLEPVMAMEIQTDETYVGAVMKDLAQRHSQILDVQAEGDARVVHAITPLSQILGYSTALRTFTSGTSSFSMVRHSYQVMTPQQCQEAVTKATGIF